MEKSNTVYGKWVQFAYWYWRPLLQQSLPCGLFSPLHMQFSWWENMQTSGYVKAGRASALVCLLSGLWACSWATLPSFCQEHKRCNHAVKQMLIGSETVFSKWCSHDWQFVTILQLWGSLSRIVVLKRKKGPISSVKQTPNLSGRLCLCSWATEFKSFE